VPGAGLRPELARRTAANTASSSLEAVWARIGVVRRPVADTLARPCGATYLALGVAERIGLPEDMPLRRGIAS